MKFTVVEAFATGDKSRYGITGYLTCTDDSEVELMTELIDAQKTVLQQNKEKRDTIKIFKQKIEYCKISIDSCGIILNMFRDNFGIDIDVELAKTAAIVPKSCEPLVNMELRRLMR